MYRIPYEVAAQSLCSDPAIMPLFDEAFHRSGSRLAHKFAREVCAECPIRLECLTAGIENNEPGFWGGTSLRARNRLREKAS